MLDILNCTNEEALADPYWYAKQSDRESDASTKAHEKALREIERQGLVDGSPVAKRSYEACVHLTAASIVDWVGLHSVSNKKPPAYSIVSTLDPYQLAMAAGLVLMNGSLQKRNTYTRSAMAIGSRVAQLVDADIYASSNPKAAKRLSEVLKSESLEYKRISILSSAMDSADFERVSWTQQDIAQVGGLLVDVFVASTGLFVIRAETESSSRQSALLVEGTASLVELVENVSLSAGLLKPMNPTMVIPPPAYTSLHSSPYIDGTLHPLDLIKGCSEGSAKSVAMYAQDLSEVYASATSVSQTAWRVNTRVLDVMQTLVDEGGGVAGLPSSTKPALPSKPWGEERMEPEEWEEYKAANSDLVKSTMYAIRAGYNAQTTWASKRMVGRQQLDMAQESRDEVGLWYPVDMDWRGRTYTATGCGAMSPQGDSRGKALLEFAKGTPLGPNGLRWLRIDAANKFGNDKVSLADRQQWTIENMPMILATAFDPIANTAWQEADDAFGFLASCFELAGASIEGEDFVSHLSVNVDATQSGMQIYSGLLKDSHGAQCVNVKDNGTGVPSDLYGLVATEMVRILGTIEDPLAKYWSGYMTRNIVKHVVMTFVYCSTAKAWTKQMTDAAIDAGSTDFGGVSVEKAAGWLSKHVKAAIGNVVSSGITGMDYIRELGSVSGKSGEGISYVSPVGFTFMYKYNKNKSVPVQITYGGTRRRMFVKAPQVEVDVRKHSTALAANLVHCLDGALIVRGVNIASDQGIEQFSVIHDSFGCPAAQVDVLSQCVRAGYEEILSPNVLQDFTDQVALTLPYGTEMPPVPAMGTLNVADVNESPYFVS